MEILVDGYRIHYRISGQGTKTAVILQGWGTELSVYDSVAAAIAEEYRVIQLDLPGFGKSEEPREPWNVNGFAVFFCKFLLAFKIRSATLIGHSYGGRVIIKLAALDRLPFRIERIVLIDSAGVLPIRTPQQERKIRTYKTLKKLLDNRVVRFLIPETVKEWKSRQGSADYRNATPVMRQCLVMAVNEDLTEYLPKVRQETLLIWGDKDTATPIRDAKIMEEKMPNAGLAVIEGTGHYSFLEDPVRFRGILQAFLLTGVKA